MTDDETAGTIDNRYERLIDGQISVVSCSLSLVRLLSVTMSLSQLPAELWLQVFSFLSWRDKLSMRCTCSYFRHLLDKSRPLWRGFSVVLRHFSQYNRPFWRSLAQRHLASVSVCSGKRKHLKQLHTWLPDLDELRLDSWEEGCMDELKLFCRLQHLSITNCSTPLKNMNYLFPLSHQLTQLSLCKVQLTCSTSHLLDAISQLTRLTSLLLHHDGSLRVPTLSGVLTHLTELKHLSWTMITHKMLSHDFFSPAHFTGKHTHAHTYMLTHLEDVPSTQMLKSQFDLLALLQR